jgi:zinc/manganese transport system substrate-binding protein
MIGGGAPQQKVEKAIMKCLVALAGAMVLGLSACSAGSQVSGTPGSSSPTDASAPVSVVASTNVYGDIAKTVGGSAVTVTSIIDNPDRDPHEYQADAQTKLALSKAQVVIENGGGYDDFVDVMLESASSRPTVINVADLSGRNRHPAGAEFNEHVWYDIATVKRLTTQLASDLSAAAPEQAATITANAAAFDSRLSQLQQQEAAIKAEHAGDPVAITEPVPMYLLQAAGLVSKTPEEFSEAVEEDTDAPPAVLKQTEDLFDEHQVELLAYNEQTTGPQTEAVLAAARRNNIPVIPLTETLPTGQTYVSWMQANLVAISAALSQ